MKINLIVVLLSLISASHASEIDEQLQEYIKTFKLAPLEKYTEVDEHLFRAGRVLFGDSIVSGNRNISCRDCHNPSKGTSDDIALSLGEGSQSDDWQRKQGRGKIIRRHSPHLINAGHKDLKHMFWDGRVSINNGAFYTPEPRLNGPNPKAAHIVKQFKTVLDAQVIFPMLSYDEMRGQPGTNDLADEKDNLKAWEMIVQRIKKERPSLYWNLKKGARGEKVNIGHVAAALGEFIRFAFQIWDTPYDRYLRGEWTALDESSKRGMKIFFTKGRCGNCHWNKHLTNQAFQSVGVPSLVEAGNGVDKGLYELTKNPNHLYAFKNPGLRNVVMTAPYMHNGVFKTLDEVIEHYDNFQQSLYSYTLSSDSELPYSNRLDVLGGNTSAEIDSSVFQPFLRRGLGLTKEEKRDLKKFLTFGLTQRR